MKSGIKNTWHQKMGPGTALHWIIISSHDGDRADVYSKLTLIPFIFSLRMIHELA